MGETVACPKCGHQFSMSDAVSKQIRGELEADFRRRRESLESSLEKMKADMERENVHRMKESTDRIKKEAVEQSQAELKDMETRLCSQASALKEAQNKELELRRKQRELEDAKQSFELELTRKMDEERSRIKEAAEERVSEEYRLKQLDWSKKQTDMERLIEDLRRKAEQGSQQTQGESLELEVESILADAFPTDELEPVEKGVSGADLALRVRNSSGASVGSILVELKRTKNFSPSWLQKLRDDQRAAKADLAVLITATMPEGVKHIGQLDGIWVSDLSSFVGLLEVLRASLVEIAKVRAAQVGQKEKAELVYEYINGNEFRGRIASLVEAIVSMRDGIESERRAYEKIWSKRDKEITRAMTSAAGFYGDLRGICGASLQDVAQLELSPE